MKNEEWIRPWQEFAYETNLQTRWLFHTLTGLKLHRHQHFSEFEDGPGVDTHPNTGLCCVVTMPMESFNQLAPGTDQFGTVHAISAETGATRWLHEQRTATDIARRDRGRAGVRRRRERPVPGLPRRDGRGTVGDQPRLAGHRLPDQLTRSTAAVRRGEHRLGRHRVGLRAPDGRAAPERGEQPVRVRSALTPNGSPLASAAVQYRL